jgi:eukaryotic-like serine/threonine-protein kinase
VPTSGADRDIGDLGRKCVESLPESFESGRYVVRRLLGRGGQKVVYLVHDTVLERDCALSLLDAEISDPKEASQLLAEAKLLAKMGAQPHVVTVFDVGLEDGRPFIVSELVEGGDLSGELPRTGGALSIARALDIARDVLEALAFVHDRGIVHRDLKPSNVWIGDRGMRTIATRSKR